MLEKGNIMAEKINKVENEKSEKKEGFKEKAKTFFIDNVVPATCTVVGIAVGVLGTLGGIRVAGDIRKAVSENGTDFGTTKKTGDILPGETGEQA